MDPVRLHRREFLQRACAFRVVYSARDWRALRGPSRIGPQGSPTSRKFASCHSPIRRFNALFPALSLSRGGFGRRGRGRSLGTTFCNLSGMQQGCIPTWQFTGLQMLKAFFDVQKDASVA